MAGSRDPTLTEQLYDNHARHIHPKRGKPHNFEQEVITLSVGSHLDTCSLKYLRENTRLVVTLAASKSYNSVHMLSTTCKNHYSRNTAS